MLIRKSLGQGKRKLRGKVEVDESYFGGRFRSGRNNINHSEAMKRKAVIVAAVEREGTIRAKVAPNTKAHTLGQFLVQNVNPQGTQLFTDESNRYDKVARDFDRFMVNHKRKEYVRGDAHVNTLESFWSHVKRSVTGTHKVISKKYLQSYVDQFVWLRNNRHNDRERFAALLGALLSVSR